MQLQILTALVHARATPELACLVFDGRVREAASRAEDVLRAQRTDTPADDDGPGRTAQLCGDLMLALDRAEEAEETYRLAVRSVAAGRRGAVRVASCRATGFMSLHLQRLGTAIACFSRLLADDASTVGDRVEALCALAMARQALGQKRRAMLSLDEARELAYAAGDADLVTLARIARAEVSVRIAIRNHELLRDHVFWTPSPSSPQPADTDGDPLAAVERELAGCAQRPLLARRLAHLRDLLLAARGDGRRQDDLEAHLAWLRNAGLATLEQQARIDTALVAITQRQHDFARAVIEPMVARDAAFRHRWGMELSYCQAKLSMLGGRSDEALRHYQRYAFESIECARAAAAAAAAVAEPVRATAVPASEAKDDIEMRLPAKYRRAYRYMQANLGCAELSVREVADGIGVSERALQWAFKSCLGMTPGEVMQRCRVERIRADLLREDSARASVTETAARWGIRNRSTLITSYRKYFRETPTQTIARRGRSDAALHA